MCLPFDSISSIYVLALHKVQNIGKNEIRKTLDKNRAFNLKKKKRLKLRSKTDPIFPKQVHLELNVRNSLFKLAFPKGVFIYVAMMCLFFDYQTFRSLRVSINTYFNSLCIANGCDDQIKIFS